MLYLVPFALPAFFPFLLSFPILMSTTAFYRGMVPVWYITGRTHTGERGQDSSRVTAMLAERLGVLRQARWFRVWAKEHHHIMLRRKQERWQRHSFSPQDENIIRTWRCVTRVCSKSGLILSQDIERETNTSETQLCNYLPCRWKDGQSSVVHKTFLELPSKTARRYPPKQLKQMETCLNVKKKPQKTLKLLHIVRPTSSKSPRSPEILN